MARSTKETDSGKYVDGVYVSKNGINNGGLNCPKGTRLYDTSMTPAVFFMPNDIGETETFEPLTSEVAPDVLPYYVISNYGRVMNINSGKVLKPNLRPNGYQYVCLAANGAKYGEKKYNIHRLVMKTFKPVKEMDDLDVDHINGIKTDNYIDKTMPDGSIQSNLEWVTHSENAIRRDNTGKQKCVKLNMQDVKTIRELHQAGYSYNQIRDRGYDFVSGSTIQNVCMNKSFVDPNYTPRTVESFYSNPQGQHIITDKEAELIRYLYSTGLSIKDIRDRFFTNFSYSSVGDIVNRVSHNRNNNDT